MIVDFLESIASIPYLKIPTITTLYTSTNSYGPPSLRMHSLMQVEPQFNCGIQSLPR